MKARGYGLGTMLYGIGYGFNRPDMGSARIEVAEDGTVTLYSGAVEMGQGLATVLAQIAAEVLGIAYGDLRVVVADTGATTDAGGTSASRATHVQGNAVIKAASNLKALMAETFSAIVGCDSSQLVFESGQVYCNRDPVAKISFKELANRRHQAGKCCTAYGWHDITTSDVDPETSQGEAYVTFAWATQLAEVEVDTETGEVTVVRLVSATDAGKAINPRAVEGQIEGGAVMGIGYALHEDYIVNDDCIPVTQRLSTYRVPTALDVPDVEPIIVEVPDPTGPFGAKGIGEPASIPTAPAILNAIHDAVGVRITDLPVRPEQVLTALSQKAIHS